MMFLQGINHHGRNVLRGRLPVRIRPRVFIRRCVCRNSVARVNPLHGIVGCTVQPDLVLMLDRRLPRRRVNLVPLGETIVTRDRVNSGGGQVKFGT